MIINTIHGQFDITQSLFEEIMRNNPEWILLEDDNATRKSSAKIIIDDIKNNPDSIDQWGVDYIKKMHDEGGITDNDFKYIKRQIGKEKQSQEEKQNGQRKSGFGSFIRTVEGHDEEEMIFKTVRQMVYSKELHKQIQEAERLSIIAVKRIKEIIQKYAGLAGSHLEGTKSQFNTYDKTKENDVANTNVSSQQTNNYSQSPIMKAENYNYDNKCIINEDNANNSNMVSEPVINKDSGKYKITSPMARKIKTGIQQAFGGFTIEPLFTNIRQAGKALKYYKSSMKPTKHSTIDNMIETLFMLKFNVDIKVPKEYVKEIKQFESMVYSFLHNVVFKLEVNSMNHYDNVIQIIHNDPTLNDLFEVNYNYTRQQFDTKENITTFRNKQDDIVDLLLVARPVLYQGRKLAKGVVDAVSHLTKTEY